MIRATTRPNRPVASHSAKPSSRLVVWVAAAPGLRRAPDRYDPNTLPMPIPAPTRAIQAIPAPIIFAAATSIFVFLLRLVMIVERKGFVEIDAGQDREDI